MNPPPMPDPRGWLARTKLGLTGLSERRAQLHAQQEAAYLEAWDDAIQIEEQRSDRVASRDAASAVPWGVRMAAEVG